MESQKFIKSLKDRVIENNISVYSNQLEANGVIKDPIWRDIIEIYRNLSSVEKESFLKFIRLVKVNTVSHILGIIDGSTPLNELNETFYLTSNKSHIKMNGNLQDIFLELEESGE